MMVDTAKEQKKLTNNFVGEFDEDEQKKIAIAICTDYDNDIQSRKDWEDKRERWFKLWVCERGKKDTPWPNASNVCIPMLATAVNQFQGRSYSSIFSPPGLLKTIPVGENDRKRAKNVEDFMNWQISYEMEEYEEVFDKLLMLLPVNGTAFKKIYYSPELERPVTEYISALDVVVPYRTKSLETARRITHRLWLHYDELEERNDRGLYENFDKVTKTPSTERNAALDITADKVTGENTYVSDDKPHLILECHKTYMIDGKRQPCIFTVHYDTKTLLRATTRNFSTGKGKEEVTLNYFVDYHFIPNPEGFYSLGFGHFLEALNEMANTAFNQIFDAGRVSNTPFGFYGRKAGIKKSEIKLEPGCMTEVEDASQVYFPSMQRLDQALFQVLGLIQQYTEQFTSTSDYLMGREAKGTKTPTASGTLAIIEQGLVTFAVMTKRIFRQLRKELRQQMQLNQLFLPDSKEYRVMEGEDSIAFPDIKQEDFSGVYDVIPIGDPSYASRTTRRQEAIERYQLLMQNPLIMQNPRAIHELTSDLLDTYGIKNKRNILPPLPDEPVEPEQENVMVMQGEKIEPKTGEDHNHHLEVHVSFMSSDYYKLLPNAYKDLLDAHIKETRKIQYEDSLMQTQGLPPQGVPQGMPQGMPPAQPPELPQEPAPVGRPPMDVFGGGGEEV